MRLLHMVSADVARTPSFALLARRGYLAAGVPAACATAVCATADPGQARGQGYAEPGANTAWLALAGPGVARRRLDATTWVDEADIRPTLLALAGLRHRYAPHRRRLPHGPPPESPPPPIPDPQ